MSQAAADTIVEEAHELFRAEKFAEAAARFEKAAHVFPPHALAWKGLGHALLCLGKAHEAARAFEVGRVIDQPKFGSWTYFTVGLSNREWPEVERPRVELVLATIVDTELCGQILANLAFHLGEIGFFPQPGVMVRDVIGALGAGDLSRRLPHVFISVPRAWDVDLPIDDDPPPITLAQVIPVSEVEYALWKSDVVGFEQRFERGLVDAADLRRPG